MSLITKLSCFLSKIQAQVLRNFEPFHPALAYNVIPTHSGVADSPPTTSLLDGLMDSILWAAVPKTRRTARKRLIRRNHYVNVRKYMTPKQHLVACLECGSYHERHTICGTCYSKVREETEVMQAAMGEHIQKFDQPRKEVTFLYQGETPQNTDKQIFEVEKPRPEWFAESLLSKINKS